MSTKTIKKNYKYLIGLPLAVGLLNEASGFSEGRTMFLPLVEVRDAKLDVSEEGRLVEKVEGAFNPFKGGMFKVGRAVNSGKVERFMKTLSSSMELDAIAGLIPQTSKPVAEQLMGYFSEDITWHPFWARTLVNKEWGSEDPKESIGYSDDIKDISEKITGDPTGDDLRIFLVKSEKKGTQVSSEQIARHLNFLGGYSPITMAIFANDNNILGGVNDKNSIVLLNIAQEEQVGHCFPGLYDRLYKQNVCYRYLTAEKFFVQKPAVLEAQAEKEMKNIRGLFSAIDGKKEVAIEDSEVFNATARDLKVLPRFAYKKSLAPSPSVVIKDTSGVISFPERLEQRSLYVKDAEQAFVSTSEPISNLQNSFGDRNLFGYNPIDPFSVNLVFTAAVELKTVVTAINTLISLSYFNVCVNILRQQMYALAAMDTKTLITGNMGCGVFRNDYRVIALAYAYVLKNYKPATLKNVAIADENFFDTLQRVESFVNEDVETTYEKFREGLPLKVDSILNPNGENPLQVKMDPSRYREPTQMLCAAGTGLANVFDVLAGSDEEALSGVVKNLSDEEVIQIRKALEDKKASEDKDRISYVNRGGKTLREVVDFVKGKKGWNFEALKARLPDLFPVAEK